MNYLTDEDIKKLRSQTSNNQKNKYLTDDMVQQLNPSYQPPQINSLDKLKDNKLELKQQWQDTSADFNRSFKDSEKNKGKLYNWTLGGNKLARAKFEKQNKEKFEKLEKAKDKYIQAKHDFQRKNNEGNKLNQLADIPGELVDRFSKGIPEAILTTAKFGAEKLNQHVLDPMFPNIDMSGGSEYQQNLRQKYDDMSRPFKADENKPVYDLKGMKFAGNVAGQVGQLIPTILTAKLMGVGKVALAGKGAKGVPMAAKVGEIIRRTPGTAMFFSKAAQGYTDTYRETNDEDTSVKAGLVMGFVEVFFGNLGVNPMNPMTYMTTIKRSAITNGLQEVGISLTENNVIRTMILGEDRKDLPEMLQEALVSGAYGAALGAVMTVSQTGGQITNITPQLIEKAQTNPTNLTEQEIVTIINEGNKILDEQTGNKDTIKENIKKVKDEILPHFEEIKQELTNKESKAQTLQGEIAETKKLLIESQQVNDHTTSAFYESRISQLENKHNKITTEIENKNTATKAIQQFETTKDFTIMKDVAKKIGYEIELIHEATSKEAGKIDLTNKKITLDVSKPNITGVFAHELTHSIENTKTYADLKNFIFENLGDEKVAQARKIINQLYKNKNLTSEQIENEVIAKVIENNLFKNKEDISTLLNTNLPLFNKINQFINKLKNRVQGTSYQDSISKTQEMFKKALDENTKKQPVKKKVAKKKELPTKKKEVIKKKEITKPEVSPEHSTKQKIDKPITKTTTEQQKTTLSKDEFRNKLLKAQEKISQQNIINETELKKILKKDNIKYNLIGEKADLTSFQLQNLVTANKMTNKNISQDKIWAATGWELDAIDGKWKTEIEYGRLKGALKPGKYKLVNIFNAPELYRAYPSIKNLEVKVVENLKFGEGWYNDGQKTITLDAQIITDKNYNVIANRLLIHEIQHAIQMTEGFSKGGSIKYIAQKYMENGARPSSPNELYYVYKHIAGEVEARNVARRSRMNTYAKESERPSQTIDVKPKDIVIREDIDSDIRYSVEFNNEVKTRTEVRNEISDILQLNKIDFSKSKDIDFAGEFRMARKHPFRINEAVFGKEVGSQINVKIFNNALENNTRKINSKKQIRENIKKLGIKPGTPEAAAAHKYAEGQWYDGKKLQPYTLDDLKREFPNNYKDVAKTSAHIRGVFDTYYDTLNEVLTKYGYDPIPKRKNYITHFKELGTIFEQVGIPNLKGGDTLPTTIAGLSTIFKPGKAFFTSQLAREGVETTYDVIKAVDKYIDQVSEVIYHTEDIQNLRTLENHIRNLQASQELDNKLDANTSKIESDHLSKYVTWLGEYTNIVAGKQSAMDRGPSALFGRKVLKVAEFGQKQLSANVIGLNPVSMLTNTITAVQAMTQIRKPAVIKGMYDYTKSLFFNDGFMDNSTFMINRYGSDQLYKTNWNKARDVAYTTMKISDKFICGLTMRAKYHDFRAAGLSHEIAMKKTDMWASKIMPGRTKWEMPLIFKSTFGKILAPFQTEVNNQWDIMVQDTFQTDWAAEHRKSMSIEQAKKYNTQQMTYQIVQYMMGMFVFNEIFERLWGRRPAPDPIGVLKRAKKHLGNENLNNEEAWLKISQEVIGQIPFADLTVGGGRFPLADAGIKMKSLIEQPSKEMERLAYIFAFPGGGQMFRKIKDGIEMYKHDVPGSYTDSGRLRFPIKTDNTSKIKNLIGGQWSTQEGREYFDNNWSPLTERQTKLYGDLNLPMKDFRKYIKDINAFETDKNYRGEPISGSALRKKRDYIYKLPIKPKQKEVLIDYIK